MIEAAIDIGTNTILLLIADVEDAGENKPRVLKKILVSEIEYARLGEGIRKTSNFSQGAMERAYRVFGKYKKICDEARAEKIYAIATSASRNAQNAKQFYEKIESEIGISVQIIPGELEANLSFLGGILPGLDPPKYAILDIGGGSTEFVTYDSTKESVKGQSLEVGSVVATEDYLEGDPYTSESLDRLEKGLKNYWVEINHSLQKELREKLWIAVAGTPTTLAAVVKKLPTFESPSLDGFKLDRCNVGDLYESLATQVNEVRSKLPVMGPGRSDVIVAGTAILLSSMEFFSKESVIVSTRGLRHGVLMYPHLLSS